MSILRCMLPILSAITIFAQSTFADPTPSSSKKLSRPEELLSFQLQFAQESYRHDSNDQTLAQLLSAFDKLVVFHCFPGLQKTLSHDPRKNSPSCHEYIQQALSLDPGDPIALCARDGLGSPICTSADAAVEVAEVGENQAPPQVQLDSEMNRAKTETKVQELAEQVEAIQRDLGTLALTDNQEGKFKIEEMLLNTMYRLLSLTCRNDFLVVVSPEKPEESEESPEKISTESEDQDPNVRKPVKEQKKSSFLNPFGEGETTEKKKRLENLPEGALSRYRMMSPTCMKYLTQFETIAPGFSSAVCARFGPVSPRCIQAMKEGQSRRATAVDRLKNKEGAVMNPTPGSEPNSNGLQEF